MATRILTQSEIATRRAVKIVLTEDRAAAKLHRAAEWSARLDPEAYTCRREGDAWIAEGPAGQVFTFRLVERFSTGHAAIAVTGMTGEYSLHVHDPGAMCVCNCPAFAAQKLGEAGCKHAVAWKAVKATAKSRQSAKRLAA